MITDKMMTDAAEELYQALLSSLPEESECVHQFSQGFERKMNRLIRRMEHPVRHRVLQRAASIALVLFLGFMALLAVSPTVRAAVFGWVRERYENLTTYYFDGEVQQNQELMEYELGYVPEGFRETYRNSSMNETIVYYVNDSSGKMMCLTYSFVEGYYSFNAEIEDCRCESVVVNGANAEFYDKGDAQRSNAIVWVDNATNTLFSITAFMDKEDLIHIAENVKKVP